MSFREFINDEVVLVNAAGERSAPQPCIFTRDKVTIFAESLNVMEGDKVIRTLPNGVPETYTILHVHYNPKRLDFEPTYRFDVRKDTSLMPASGSKTTNVTISHSQGFQVGDYNVQHVISSFMQLAQEIEASDASPEQKAEAKSRLVEFLSHPLVNTLLGAGAGGLMQALS